MPDSKLPSHNVKDEVDDDDEDDNDEDDDEDKDEDESQWLITPQDKAWGLSQKVSGSPKFGLLAINERQMTGEGKALPGRKTSNAPLDHVS